MKPAQVENTRGGLTGGNDEHPVGEFPDCFCIARREAGSRIERFNLGH